MAKERHAEPERPGLTTCAQGVQDEEVLLPPDATPGSELGRPTLGLHPAAKRDLLEWLRLPRRHRWWASSPERPNGLRLDVDGLDGAVLAGPELLQRTSSVGLISHWRSPC